MRGREFTMKDAYSFDRDLDAARHELRPDVRRLRAHLRPLRPASSAPSRPTTARSAAIRSHEFQVIADTGEDAIVYCPDSDYAANIELAEALAPAAPRAARRRRR